MDPRRFLDVALTLKGGPGSAELYRTSIGRAYYAAFNVGVETLWSIGVQCSRGPGAHGELMNCLRGGGDQACQRIGALLQTLHSRRIDSDYEMADPGVETRAEADLACREASAVIIGLDKLRADPSLVQTRADMKVYAGSVLRLQVT